jgi:hypothetical protein
MIQNNQDKYNLYEYYAPTAPPVTLDARAAECEQPIAPPVPAPPVSALDARTTEVTPDGADETTGFTSGKDTRDILDRFKSPRNYVEQSPITHATTVKVAIQQQQQGIATPPHGSSSYQSSGDCAPHTPQPPPYFETGDEVCLMEDNDKFKVVLVMAPSTSRESGCTRL